MKASAAFVFFLLFLAGLAFVNLYDMRGSADSIDLLAHKATLGTCRNNNRIFYLLGFYQT